MNQFLTALRPTGEPVRKTDLFASSSNRSSRVHSRSLRPREDARCGR
jgi:hypothetical protein